MNRHDPNRAGPRRKGGDRRLRAFHLLLANTLAATVAASFLWFAVTYWIFLETRSVTATALIGGAYMLLLAIFGIPLGALADRLRVRTAMITSSSVTLLAFAAAGVLVLTQSPQALADLGSPVFWCFTAAVLTGSTIEQLRTIALAKSVTILVHEDRRDRANGLVGAVQGIALLTTSVFSGLSVGLLGIGWTVVIALVATGAALLQMLGLALPTEPAAAGPGDSTVEAASGSALPGVLVTIRQVPGLLPLLLFTMVNNLLAGVIMALKDPYGLTLFGVETWGLVFALTSIGFVVGGGIVARFGLGVRPVRTFLFLNAAIALVGATFTLREWNWLLIAGLFAFMILGAAIESAEHTIIQRVVPYASQGRVFGFASALESAAAPIAAFAIGPLAEFWLIPVVESDGGAGMFGWLLGPGEARGIALAITLASGTVLLIVAIASGSAPFRRLAREYDRATPRAPSDLARSP